MNVLDLFSGIGGISLGLERAGMQTVAFCESEPYCRQVLAHHWPGIPCFDDVRTLCATRLAGFGRIDIIAGGFPCQPVSVAGSRKGEFDERWLWPEMYRIVREVRPAWILAENVPGLRTIGADRVLSDLEAAGYTTWPLVVGADDVGAPHRRKRVWIVAHRQNDGIRWGRELTEVSSKTRSMANRDVRGRDGQRQSQSAGIECASGRESDRCDGEAVGDAERITGGSWPLQSRRGSQGRTAADGSSEGMGDAAQRGLRMLGRESVARDGGYVDGAESAMEYAREPGSQERYVAAVTGDARHAAGRHHAWPAPPGPQYRWEPPRVIARAQSGVGGGVDGLPGGLLPRDRRAQLKALGNSVVPQIVEIIGQSIMHIESLFHPC